MKELRHRLHKVAELSGNEKLTSSIIKESLERLGDGVEVSTIAGFGVMAAFDSNAKGNTVLYRADLDALPINEETDLPYVSTNKGVSHKCGHDGHAAILYGLAQYIYNHPPVKGKAVLLFQPSEETGEGAERVINDPLFKSINPDYCFAMHNLPGYPLHSMVIRESIFAAASKGIIIHLKGRTSHASEPEKGLSPANVLAELMKALPNLANNNPQEDNYSLITLIHANLGSPAFGTSPGSAVLMLTLRAYSDREMELLTRQVKQLVDELAVANKLEHRIVFTEVFPATINDPEAVQIVESAAKDASLQVINKPLPFNWSEDFAHFTALSKGALFGIGAGENHLPLHNPHYDFPDELLETGLEIWKAIYHKVNF